ncbi:MAG: hypothetical protein LQ343_001154 [Gyalolechia ehrenbergii]|nr:MAG: hypothetical protein LQ343_001154 [Gyalolechia ehrenbergii]
MLDFQRLYISPLNPELLQIILSESVRQSARNITYHTLQTFPDRRYGYIDLPAPEADRLRKKLHGSILQGAKMKVEKARPKKMRKGSRDSGEEDIESKSRQEKKGRSRATQEQGVLPGVELPNDRKIKRGWTEPSAKQEKKPKNRKKLSNQEAARKPSAHTDEPECLFKAKIPPNARINAPQGPVEATASKKRKRTDAGNTHIVHEFEKTIKHPSFLRSEAGTIEKKPASSYVEGKGWVDEDGKILEAEKCGRRFRSKATGNKDGNAGLPDICEEAAESGSKRGVLRSRGSKVEVQRPILNDATSSSGDSSSESKDDTLAEGGETLEQGRQSNAPVKDDNGETGINANQVRALSTSRSSPIPPLDPVKEVHPLEALFKRPKNAASQPPQKPSLEVRTGFSFFGPDVEQEDNVPLIIPQTPFTQQDFQERRLRSAAPTPDTAAPGKTTFGRLWSQDSGRRDSASDEDQGDDQTTPTAPTMAGQRESGGDAKESDFAKWFYEHRGETNRAWKRRRREAAKEKRQKENKRR